MEFKYLCVSTILDGTLKRIMHEKIYRIDDENLWLILHTDEAFRWVHEMMNQKWLCLKLHKRPGRQARIP